MYSVLYKCEFFSIYTYGVFVAIAFFVTSWLASREAKKVGLNDDDVYNLCIVLLVCGIVSARIFYVALNWDYFRQDLFEVVKLQHGGLVWFGGLIGAVISALIFLRMKKLPVMPTIDFFAPYVALAQAIGRIGCFFNGCCYGKESPFGIFLPEYGKILFPAQLLDSVVLLTVFLILKTLSNRFKTGVVFSFYLILAGLERFAIEFFRGDDRPFYYSLSIFQWIGLFVSMAGVLILVVLLWKKKHS